MASVDRKRYSSRASIVGADIESCFQRAENSQCFLTQSCDVGMADIAVDLSGVSRVQSKTISSILQAKSTIILQVTAFYHSQNFTYQF